MQGNIYAIYDAIAETNIGGLQIHKHDAAAIRIFGDICADPQSMIAKHPKDFSLVVLGRLEDNNTITPLPTPETLITGAIWFAANTTGPKLATGE